MITLRTYSNPAEAAMAKSLLENYKIICSLADENSNLYGGGPLAMPIRLLVDEEQVEQANQILDNVQQPLPDDFDPGPDKLDAPKDPNQEILSEIGKLRQTSQFIALGVIVILLMTVYILSELPRHGSSPWTEVGQATRRYDYDKALKLAKAITAQYPKDYYGHEYLGNIYREMGDLDHAEEEYSRAYDLSPPQLLQEKLKALRERRRHEEATLPNPFSTP
jgi:tetratricopeptide (TPR) repeat protein